MVVVPIAYGVIALIAALGALLAYMGTRQMFSPLLDYLKWILGPVSLVLDIVTNDATARMVESAKAAAESAATIVAHYVAAIPEGLTQLVDAILVWASAVVASLAATGQAISDAVTSTVVALIQAAVATLRYDVDTLFNVYLPNLQWFMEQVQLELWNALNALTARVEAIEQWAGQSIEAAVAGAVAALGASIEALRQELAATAAGIEAGIEARIGAAAAAIDGYVQGLVDALAREIAAVRTALADAIPGINTRIDEVAATGAAVATATAVEILTLKDWIDKCGEPLCDSYGPDIPFVKDLVSLLETGAIVAWVIAAIEDPEGTADFTADFVGGTVSSVGDALAAVA